MGRAPFRVLLPPGAWTATTETPPWAQASSVGPASVLGPPALASITGLPATWTARSGRVLCLCAPGYAGEARLPVANPWPFSPVREASLCQGHLCVKLQARRLSSGGSRGERGRMGGITDTELVSREVGLNITTVSSALRAELWTFWLGVWDPQSSRDPRQLQVP